MAQNTIPCVCGLGYIQHVLLVGIKLKRGFPPSLVSPTPGKKEIFSYPNDFSNLFPVFVLPSW